MGLVRELFRLKALRNFLLDVEALDEMAKELNPDTSWVLKRELLARVATARTALEILDGR